MRLLLLTFLTFCCAALGLAQQSVQGTVIDPDGVPVIGATVIVTGTTVGTITDIDGNFDLTVPEDGASLTVSYIGYDPQTIEVGDESVFNSILSEGVALDEVVVTGYSVGTKREATGAISTIAADKLTAIPSGNVEQQLQGRAAGVTVITNGQPGTESKVRVRGFGSFSDNQPLYIVDGVPTNGIGFLPPEDIESTSVLKDAASASIYGARAASGVIVVQTKRGSRSNEGVQVSYDGLIGVTNPGDGLDILNPRQQAGVIYEGLQNDLFLTGANPDTATITSSFYDFSDPDNIGLPDFLVSGERSAVFGQPTDEEVAAYNDNLASGRPISLIIPANKEGTDWYDEITRRAILTRHNLGFSGGSDEGRYYFGLSYQNQEGILIGNDFTRYAFRANSEFDVIPSRVRIGENLQVAFINNIGQLGGGGGQGVANQESPILSAFRNSPIIPARIGAPGGPLTGYGGNVGNNGLGNDRNPLAGREAQFDNTNNNLQAFGNVYAEVDIIDGLYAKTLFGGTYGVYNGRGFGRATYENIENTLSNTYSEFNGNYASWVWTNTLNYDFKIGSDHSIKGLVGYEANVSQIGYFANSGGTDPFITDPDFVSISQVGNRFTESGFNTERTFSSIFGQLNYNYQGKYYLTGVVRRDESSAFSAGGNTAGIFPAVSAAWRVTGESFAQPNDVLSDLKIRGGYGIMGNSNAVRISNGFALFGSSIAGTGYDINGSNSTVFPGFVQSQIPNPGARWEESITSNVGVEATLFGTSLDIVVDLWQKRNEGVLFNPPTANTGGNGAAPFRNVATIDNKGIDLLLTYRDRVGDFDYEASITGSWLDNEIIEIAPDLDFFDSGGQARLSGSAVRNRVGQPISSFFGYQQIGLWQLSDFQTNGDLLATNDEGQLIFADGTAVTNGAAPGRFRFADLNGVDDDGNVTSGANGTIGPEDRVEIGNAVPKFTGGFNLKLGYKGFDIETFLYASLGNDVLNNQRYYTDFLQTFTSGSAKSTRLLDAWSPTNQDSEIPILESTSNFFTNSEINSYYVEDGSYLRMRHLTVGYTVPTEVFNGAFSRARFTASATNLFTITGYTGLDPAIGGAADTNFGIDVGNYPVTRAFNFGVSLGF